jgi:hypothetical protein
MSITIIKVIVILMLLAIVGSLFSALIFLYRNQGQKDRMVKALTLRIGLSMTLFALLMAGAYFGIIPPMGLRQP